jgi:hypothetical protein
VLGDDAWLEAAATAEAAVAGLSQRATAAAAAAARPPTRHDLAPLSDVDARRRALAAVFPAS